MGLLSILKKVRQMEREMRILMVYVPRPPPPPRAPAPRLFARCRGRRTPRVAPEKAVARQHPASRARAAAAKVTGAVCGAAQGPGQRGQDYHRQKVQWRGH